MILISVPLFLEHGAESDQGGGGGEGLIQLCGELQWRTDSRLQRYVSFGTVKLNIGVGRQFCAIFWRELSRTGLRCVCAQLTVLCWQRCTNIYKFRDNPLHKQPVKVIYDSVDVNICVERGPGNTSGGFVDFFPLVSRIGKGILFNRNWCFVRMVCAVVLVNR